MAASNGEPRARAERSSSDRLDSWKEIAVYLKRSVRTVQRWEGEAELPVRRHLHSKAGTVYAYTEELDAWWDERRPDQEAPTTRLRARPATRLTLMSLAGLLLIVTGWWLSRRDSTPAIDVPERGWLLVAEPDNLTTDPALDGITAPLLRRELSRSHRLNVVPAIRIEDALRLLGEPPAAALTSSLAREVALRDGGVDLLLTGSIEPASGGLLLTVRVAHPRPGAESAVIRQPVPTKDDLASASRLVATRIREILGLETSEADDVGPMGATSASPEAHRLFSMADRLIASGNNAAAIRLLREALKRDEDFSVAHTFLAWAMNNVGKPPAEYLPLAARAVELSESATLRERYFIRASYEQMTGNLEQAAASYQALLALYPDDFWATNNLEIVFYLLKQHHRSVPYTLRLAELRPTSFQANLDAAKVLAMFEGDPENAERFVAKSSRLISDYAVSESATGVVWVETFPIIRRWLDGDAAAALRELDELLAVWLESGSPWNRLPEHLGPIYVTLGRLERTEELIRAFSRGASRHERLAAMAFLRGDEGEMGRHLSEGARAGTLKVLYSPGLLARLGRVEEARALLVPGRRVLPMHREVALGEIAAATGRLADAERHLREGIDLLAQAPQPAYFMATETLSRLWLEAGETSRVLELLESASRLRVKAAFFPPSGAFWMRTQIELAEARALSGRLADAKALAADLRSLLAVADSNHPVAQRLERLERTFKSDA